MMVSRREIGTPSQRPKGMGWLVSIVSYSCLSLVIIASLTQFHVDRPCVVPRLSVMHGDSGAPPVYDKAELELLVTDQRENLESRQNKRKEVKRGPPSKKRKFATNTISRFSYKERKVEDKTSESEAMDFKVTATNNVERKIVPSAEVITRNSFKGGNAKDEEVESTTNAKVAIKLNSKQTKISSFIIKK